MVIARDDPMGAVPIGEQLADALPDAELCVVDGGHARWVHHADQIAPLIAAFVSRSAGTSIYET